MTQQQLFPEATTKPQCPACKSTELRAEGDDRHQCNRCGWRCRMSRDGTVRDWLVIASKRNWRVRVRRVR